jgi:hypothetical protein
LKSLAVEETAVEAIAAATLAMRKGELDLAAREIERVMSESPDATEIPALTLLLERARGASVPTAETTEVETQRKKELPPAPRIAPPRAREPERRPAPARPILPWVLGSAAAVLLAVVGVLGLRAIAPPEPSPDLQPPAPTSVAAATSTAVPPTSVAPATTTLRATTTMRLEPTTTAIPTSSVSATIPSSSSTTSSAPPSITTTEAPVATTTAVAAPPVRPEDQIAELMHRYEAAYEGLDVNALGAIYPAVPLAVKNSFQNFKTLELSLQPISGPEVSRSTAGPTATAVYRVLQTVEPKVGKTTVSRHQATFLYAGVGTAWIIVRVDFREDR